MPSIIDKVGDLTDSIKDSVRLDVDEIKRAGRDCHAAARETSALCSDTVAKASRMVEFGLEIRSTLRGFSDGEPDATALEAVRDLVAGDRVRRATDLASEMDALAGRCVERSASMISAMERGVRALPDAAEGAIEGRVESSLKKGGDDFEELRDVERDVRAVSECVDAVGAVNLFTVMDAGVKAFDVLSAKGEVCKKMFGAIRRFADDVVSISDTVQNFDFSKMVGKIKDLMKSMWRCLRLSGLMKRIAEQAGRLIRRIIDLFKQSSSKLGAIWGALARAKDCMADCVRHVLEAMRLCDEAVDKSALLIETSGRVRDRLEGVLATDRKSMVALRELVVGDEMPLAIGLAASMDEAVKAAAEKVIAMIQRVTEGFDGLPGAIRDGIPNADEAGSRDEDPAPADVEGDVRDLDRCRGAIDGSNAVGVVRASADGFSGVSEKVGVCQGMIQSSRSFAGDCHSTIDSFLGVWDLHAAQDKILEMCRLVRLGEIMRQLAEQIIKLVTANIAVMTAARNKIKGMSNFLPDEVENVVCSCVHGVTENMDDIKKLCKMLRF